MLTMREKKVVGTRTHTRVRTHTHVQPHTHISKKKTYTCIKLFSEIEIIQK